MILGYSNIKLSSSAKYIKIVAKKGQFLFELHKKNVTDLPFVTAAFQSLFLIPRALYGACLLPKIGTLLTLLIDIVTSDSPMKDSLPQCKSNCLFNNGGPWKVAKQLHDPSVTCRNYCNWAPAWTNNYYWVPSQDSVTKKNKWTVHLKINVHFEKFNNFSWSWNWVRVGWIITGISSLDRLVYIWGTTWFETFYFQFCLILVHIWVSQTSIWRTKNVSIFSMFRPH